MAKRLAAVQTSAPEPEIRARVDGTPSPAALESFAAFLLERIQARRQPALKLVTDDVETKRNRRTDLA